MSRVKNIIDKRKKIVIGVTGRSIGKSQSFAADTLLAELQPLAWRLIIIEYVDALAENRYT